LICGLRPGFFLAFVRLFLYPWWVPWAAMGAAARCRGRRDGVRAVDVRL